MDLLCGQNWIEQFASNLQRTSFEWAHDKDLVEVTDDYGVDVINESFDWDDTAQGCDVWSRRDGGFCYSRDLIY